MSKTASIHEPSSSVLTRISRRLVRYQHVKKLRVKTERPIVSFTFDDCPKSVIENAFPILNKHNWKSTVYISMGLCDKTNHLGLHMSETDVQESFVRGHDIGNHTFSHLDARAVSQEDFLADILKNEAALRQINIPQCTSFAYPYGEITADTKDALSEMFSLNRGIHSSASTQHYDVNQAASQRLYSGDDFKACSKAIRTLKTKPGWIIIFTHDVRDTPSPYGCTPEEFNQIANLVDSIDAEVMTVSQALNRFKNTSVKEASL